MSHSGGLCSYGLLLMVLAYLQHTPANTAAAAGCSMPPPRRTI